MPLTNPFLVIFDCDGVLVDTEDVANRLLVRLLGEQGLALSCETCRALFVGRTIEAVQSYGEEKTGRRFGADWAVYVREETQRCLEQGVEAIPGVERQVERLLRLGVPFCVASSGNLSKMQTSLGQAGLLPFFKDVLFSAERVAQGKPAPDLFLYAAARMGQAPERCVVIEDSVPGVEAGLAAGMRVLGYAGDPHTDVARLEKTGAETFASMETLPWHLERVTGKAIPAAG